MNSTDYEKQLAELDAKRAEIEEKKAAEADKIEAKKAAEESKRLDALRKEGRKKADELIDLSEAIDGAISSLAEMLEERSVLARNFTYGGKYYEVTQAGNRLIQRGPVEAAFSPLRKFSSVSGRLGSTRPLAEFDRQTLGAL